MQIETSRGIGIQSHQRMEEKQKHTAWQLKPAAYSYSGSLYLI